MNRRLTIGGRIVLAVAAAVFLAGSAAGQSSGSPYPYWGSAPESYRGSSLRVPVPGPSLLSISNASRSTPFDPDRALYRRSAIGGGFLPPSLTARDIDLRFLQSNRAAMDTRAHIWLYLPAKAEVWMNGVKTRQTGESRYYYSPPLTPGREYAYQMRIHWLKDGKPVEKTERILVHAGTSVRRDVTRSKSDGKSASSSGGRR